VFYYAFAGFGPRESGEAGQLVGLLKVGMKLRCLPKEYEKQQLEKQNKGNRQWRGDLKKKLDGIVSPTRHLVGPTRRILQPLKSSERYSQY
jgi:hypothetical protein